MNPDIWEEWWRPAYVMDLQPAMWSTRCRRACVRSHAKRHTGCHQPEAYRLLSPINTPTTPDHFFTSRHVQTKLKPSVQFNLTKPVIFSYNQVEVLSKIISVPLEVLLDAPPGSLENCPEARGGSVRVQISLSRPISFYMVKPRLCPSQDQSSPFQSSHPLGFGQVFSDQRAAYRQRTLGFKETPYSLDREHSERRDHGPWLSGYTDGVVTGSDPTVLGLSRGDPTVLWAAIIV
ncbi:hypothetical protein F2Q70_00018351 [Brassica cretica]|uniref:Uncharacterized protein n=1 Tax=Brassica cretica TaxID=69181 RepID=A0A8S9HVU8_BRACR|nr:hypothetical protein F2Q70_00018351 [Brassica cretica]